MWTIFIKENREPSHLISSPGNEGNIFQIDEDTGNITMTKAADIVGPIILTVLVKKTLASTLSAVILNGKCLNECLLAIRRLR